MQFALNPTRANTMANYLAFAATALDRHAADNRLARRSAAQHLADAEQHLAAATALAPAVGDPALAARLVEVRARLVGVLAALTRKARVHAEALDALVAEAKSPIPWGAPYPADEDTYAEKARDIRNAQARYRRAHAHYLALRSRLRAAKAAAR